MISTFSTGLQPNRFLSVNKMDAKWRTKENIVRYIIRTIAAGAISIAARIIIKKIQKKGQTDSSTQDNDIPNPVSAPAK